MKMLFTIIAIIITTLAVVGQHLDLDLGPDPDAIDTTKAPNVSIGKAVTTALYPDQAEFKIDSRNMQLTCIWIDTWGDAHETKYDAVVCQIGPVCRAEVDPFTWVEINTATGTTFVHQHCTTRAYLHPEQTATAGY